MNINICQATAIYYIHLINNVSISDYYYYYIEYRKYTFVAFTLAYFMILGVQIKSFIALLV